MNKRNHIVIDVHRGSQSESWLVVYPDGRIQYHAENDGYAYLRHGAEAVEEWLTMDDVRALARRHSHKLTEAVEAAIRDLNTEEMTDEEAEAIEEREDPRGHYEK